MTVKQELYNQCHAYVTSMLLNIENAISVIQESLLSETKSSAGDKHETGRAMIQLEREKTGQQLAETQKLKESLAKIDISKTCDKVFLGSVVYTNLANYFISISAGKLKVNSIEFFAISPKTPIGQLLFAKKAGDKLVFRDQKIEIIKVI